MRQEDTKRINIPTQLATDLHTTKPHEICLTKYVIGLLKTQAANKNNKENSELNLLLLKSGSRPSPDLDGCKNPPYRKRLQKSSSSPNVSENATGLLD